MTAQQVICRRWGKPFTPAREDFVRGTWRGCPGCRSEATVTPRGDGGPAKGEIHQRLRMCLYRRHSALWHTTTGTDARYGREGGVNRCEQIEAVRQAQRTSPEPAQVRQSRDRYDRGELLGDNRQSRPWCCQYCDHTAHGPVIPVGWYSVTRYSGSCDVKPSRLGVSCSAACLGPQTPRLIGVEADAGDWWQDTHERERRT